MNSAALHPIKEIHGAYILENKTHQDERGIFHEVTRNEFKQINLSISHGNTLRGMHLQTMRSQGKLITPTSGVILDVALDLRKDSPTYKKYFAVELGAFNGLSFYVPPGCAHGFLVLSPLATVMYACTEHYDPQSDTGVKFDSFGFDWPIDQSQPFFISERDRALPSLDDYIRALG